MIIDKSTQRVIRYAIDEYNSKYLRDYNMRIVFEPSLQALYGEEPVEFKLGIYQNMIDDMSNMNDYIDKMQHTINIIEILQRIDYIDPRRIDYEDEVIEEEKFAEAMIQGNTRYITQFIKQGTI